MNLKRLTYGTGAAVLVAGGLMAGSLAYAQTPSSPEVERAKAAALGAVEGGVEVLEVETEREDGQLVYEVDVRAQSGQVYEVEIVLAGDTAQVLEIERDDDDEGDDEDDDGGDDDDDDDDGPIGQIRGFFGDR